MQPWQSPYTNPGTDGPSPDPEGQGWNNDPWRNGDGVIMPSSFRKPRKIASITDGTSNTVMVGEDVFGRITADIGSNWVHTACEYRLLNCPINLRNSSGQFSKNWYDLGFYSFHTGGANFGMADGSVRFLSDTTALGTLRSLGTIGGGEVVQMP